ncbi:MAG TPA: hypothetical protein VGK09_12575 [Rhodocyclaceae bacterium]|jgi:hypothetical protein
MLFLVIAVTLIIKVMFPGWGLGIPFLDFSGISGHALLAAPQLPELTVSNNFFQDYVTQALANIEKPCLCTISHHEAVRENSTF